MDKIIAKLKEYFDIEDIERIDFDNIDRSNPPIFGPEDIFEDIYDDEDDSDIIIIALLLIIPIIAFVFSLYIFIDAISSFSNFTF